MKFYAVLMEKRKEEEAYLVTGNIKHFPVKTYVVTPREMLDIIHSWIMEEQIQIAYIQPLFCPDY